MLGATAIRAPRALLALLTAGAVVLAACGGAPPAPTAAPANGRDQANRGAQASRPGRGIPGGARRRLAGRERATSPAASPATSPAAASASPATAASPPRVRRQPGRLALAGGCRRPPTVSGEVDSVDGRVVSVATATGLRSVRVADNASVLIEGQGSAEDLKAGVLVGITGKPDGTAVIVRLFPPGITPKPSQFPMGGPQAGNVMTNASIVSFDGKALVVDLGGEQRDHHRRPETQIVKPVPSSFAEIKPGHADRRAGHAGRRSWQPRPSRSSPSRLRSGPLTLLTGSTGYSGEKISPGYPVEPFRAVCRPTEGGMLSHLAL